MQQLEQLYSNEKYLDFLELAREMYQTQNTINVSQEICDALVKYYDVTKIGVNTEILNTLFSENPIINNQIKTPINPFLMMCLITGAVEVYQEYCSCHLNVITREMNENEMMDYYTEMYSVSEELVDGLFHNYKTVFKGTDYNGKMVGINENTDFVMLPTKDYYLMEDLIENYNKIVGRRDIFFNISERYENC